MTNQPLDTSNLSAKFEPYYHSGQRIEVTSPYGETLRGYVGKTTGWRPSYLLLSRSNSIGSSELLNDKHQIVKTLPKYRYGRGA